jgi:hypothetical protein
MSLVSATIHPFVNGLLPQCGVAQSDGRVHSDVFEEQPQHVEPFLIRPEHPALDQLDLFWTEFMVFLLDLVASPLCGPDA